MKNKKLLYFLVPSVLLIWALIIYRVIGHYSSDESSDQQIINQDQKFTIQQEKDSFQITADYRDPFLGKTNRIYNSYVESPSNGNSRSYENKINDKKPLVKNTGKNFVWPALQYGGLVVNNNTNDIVGLLTVNSGQTDHLFSF